MHVTLLTIPMNEAMGKIKFNKSGLTIIEGSNNSGKIQILNTIETILSGSTELIILDQKITNHLRDVKWQYKYGGEYKLQTPFLQYFRNKKFTFEDLNWRQFEILITELLESDGHDIKLMSGRNDGGVDIISVQDIGGIGKIKTIWQAKKFRKSNKIGISIIRELADARNEFKASKAIIITSSSLTSGALNRINRDKYILGKIDRNDLYTWITNKLLN